MALIRPIPVNASATLKMASAVGGVSNGFTIVGDTYTKTTNTGSTGNFGTIDDLTFAYSGSQHYTVTNAGSTSIEVTNMVNDETHVVAGGATEQFTSSGGFVTVL